MGLRIALCTGQVPLNWGGAEALTLALAEQLREHGHEADIVQIPFRAYPRQEILKGHLVWRLINLEESEGRPIDRVIALKFPGYVVSHPYKITWLIQQFRQVYDLFGSPYSDFTDSPADTELRQTIWRIDTQTLQESRRIFTIARNVGARLRQYNGLQSEAIYPPPLMDGQFYHEGYGDYIFTISRLHGMKRVDQLVRAMGKVKTPVRCRIAGRGEEFEALRRLAREIGATDRIDFLGFLSNDQVLENYARALAVYYAPWDEDYGYVTVEGMKSQKPVLTTTGSGGVLEFVEDGVTGFVTPADDSAALARRIDELYEDRQAVERMGIAGLQKVQSITWEAVIGKLLEA